MNKKKLPSRHGDWPLKIFLAAVLLLAGGKFLLEQDVPEVAVEAHSARAVFANCLNRQGAMMYGVDTCDFCLSQKKMFGEDFREVNYINCDFSRDLCRQKGILRLPAWEIKGKIIYGLQSFEELSLQTGCKPPTKAINQ